MQIDTIKYDCTRDIILKYLNPFLFGVAGNRQISWRGLWEVFAILHLEFEQRFEQLVSKSAEHLDRKISYRFHLGSQF